MYRASHEVFTRAALAGDQDGEVVALHALDLLEHPIHRGAGADEPWEQRVERSLADRLERLRRTVAQPAQFEALTSNGREHAQPATVVIRRVARHDHGAGAWAVVVLPEWLREHDTVAMAAIALRRRLSNRPAFVGAASSRGDEPKLACRRRDEHDRCVCADCLEKRGRRFARQQSRQDRRFDQPANHRIVRFARRDHGRRPGELSSCACVSTVSARSRLAPSAWNTAPA